MLVISLVLHASSGSGASGGEGGGGSPLFAGPTSVCPVVAGRRGASTGATLFIKQIENVNYDGTHIKVNFYILRLYVSTDYHYCCRP